MTSTIDRDPMHLHPDMRAAYLRLKERLRSVQWEREAGDAYEFRLFEGYRHPARQDLLFKRGTTKARAWSSAHQYGLAVDMVPYRIREGSGRKQVSPWTWDDDAPWHLLAAAASETGLLNTIKWDKPHVEHPKFRLLR